VPQGKLMCSYLQQAKMSSFFFCKIREQESRTSSAWGVGDNGSGEKSVGEGGWIYCKFCVHMYINGKMIIQGTIPGMGGGRDKKEWWSGWI
jgi:hypothetical protein